MKKILLLIVVISLSAGSFFTINAQTSNAQASTINAIKAEALREMNVGRYGEAIALLNRYIAARPQQPDGYNDRGLCYEKRKEYEYAVYDYRSARKLAPKNKEINANLSRATKLWYSLLYNNIEGYKREIAINPNKADNYLAIGKDYKNLGEWAVAEQWYDKYLTMAHASPDELIRYSEILAKTGHIAKGWPILKRYTEEYPNDQRLWSRFGYFSLWLGKTRIAIKAFENALALKPYFKEAQDGLDMARGKGYVYTVNDTSYYKRYYNYGLPPKRPRFVYPIDRYYGIIRRHPGDNEVRLKLVNALIDAKRFEEASQQLTVLQDTNYDSLEVANLTSKVDSLSQIYYMGKIQVDKTKLAADSTNKDVVLELGQYYTKLQDYDSALVVYANYLNMYPDDQDVLYKYAQVEANNREFFKAQEKMQTLIKMEPNNLKYQLFLAQLDTWIGQNLDVANKYLDNVLANDPNNIAALVTKSSLSMQKNDFATAQEYMGKIKAINPNSSDLKSLQNALTMNKFRYKEEQNYAILAKAEKLYSEGKCAEAIPEYEEFLSNSPDNSLIEKEYADVNVCAGNYQKAVDIYTDLLNKGYDFNIDYARASTYLAMGDSVNALAAFQRLAKDHPDNFNVNLNLGDSYFRMHEYGKAEDVYDRIKENMKLDSTQLATVNMRYKWMPVTGFRGILSSFPTYSLLTPYASYYADNLGIRNNVQGLRLDLGVTNFLTVGAEAFRSSLSSNVAQLNSNSIRWDITLRLERNLLFGVDFGNTYYGANFTRPIADIFLRTGEANHYSLSATYSKLDASQLIYSLYLIGVRIEANTFRLAGSYQTKSGIRTSADYTYYSFGDGNRGFNLMFRIGKYFYPDFMLGYEYYGIGWQRTSYFYYSPTSAASHNIFADWDIIKDSTLSVTIGGLIGFIANSNSIIRQGYAAATWHVADRFTVQARLAGGGSFQNVVGYSSVGFTLSAYWAL